MIAVVGAAGKTGRAVLRALESRNESVRPLVRRPNGSTGEVVVDLLDAESVSAALQGVDAVYHMAPNMHPAEVQIGRRVIKAAQSSGVERIVFHSVLHPQIRAMPHHWDKLRVEKAVIKSGLRWTILQPAPYVQNFTRPPDGVLRVAYRADAPFSFVDLMDVAAAAALVLASDVHDLGIYELAGPEILTVADVAATLGSRVESIDPVTWQRTAVADGLSPAAAARLTAMFKQYDLDGLVGNPAALELILGRAPNHALKALLRYLEQPIGRPEPQIGGGRPCTTAIIALTNLYWTRQSAPGRTAATVETKDVDFGGASPT